MFFVLFSLNQVLCLHMAARGGDLAKVKNLVENGGDVNIKHNRSGVSIILNYYFDISTGAHFTVLKKGPAFVTCTTMIAISIIKHLVQK